MHNPATLRILARAGLWSVLAFVLNLTWEIAQARLYTIWAEADGLSLACMDPAAINGFRPRNDLRHRLHA